MEIGIIPGFFIIVVMVIIINFYLVIIINFYLVIIINFYVVIIIKLYINNAIIIGFLYWLYSRAVTILKMVPHKFLLHLDFQFHPLNWPPSHC